jgi:hypothetical protein
MTHLTHKDWEALKKAWLDGNVEDEGSAFGEDGDTPREAAEREGYEVLAVDADGSALVHSRHRHYYLVRLDNGPWGVDVTSVARGVVGRSVPLHA